MMAEYPISYLKHGEAPFLSGLDVCRADLPDRRFGWICQTPMNTPFFRQVYLQGSDCGTTATCVVAASLSPPMARKKICTG